MMNIGIRHEDKYLLEKRVAITPEHVKKLREDYPITFYVQKSAKRIFTDKEYEQAGAILVDDIPPEVNTIFGVKEMPSDFFKEKHTYVFFSHVIKGQTYNMPMLRALKDKHCNLIDYEKITDEQGRRLIFFGYYAGLAGAINSFWSLGERWSRKGINTPFGRLKQSHKYSSLAEAKEEFIALGREIAQKGLPEAVGPLVVGITGYGNVSRGSQEIIQLMPHKEIAAEDLPKLDLSSLDKHHVYYVVFKEQDLSEPVDSSKSFNLQHYYDHPEEYRNQFERYVPKLSLLINAMYWSPKYPRIITKDFLYRHFSEGNTRLEVIGDITCDPNGSIECTHMGTLIQDPVFVYNPLSRQAHMGFDGKGILVMAVDILPSELPREASEAFSNFLQPFIPAIAAADYSRPFDELELPAEIKRALILHQGRFTPDFEYIEKYLIKVSQ